MPISYESSSQAALWNIIVHQHERTAPRNRWVNTFTISTNSAVLANDTAFAICNAIGTAFLSVMNANVTLERIRLCTYVPRDTVPYDANEFIVVPFNQFGTIVRAQPMLPSNVAVMVDKVVATGRNGRFMVRGLLNSADVYEGLGGYVLSAAGVATCETFATATYNALTNLAEGIFYVVPSVNKDQSALPLPSSRAVLRHEARGVTVTRHSRAH